MAAHTDYPTKVRRAIADLERSGYVVTVMTDGREKLHDQIKTNRYGEFVYDDDDNLVYETVETEHFTLRAEYNAGGNGLLNANALISFYYRYEGGRSNGGALGYNAVWGGISDTREDMNYTTFARWADIVAPDQERYPNIAKEVV